MTTKSSSTSKIKKHMGHFKNLLFFEAFKKQKQIFYSPKIIVDNNSSKKLWKGISWISRLLLI